jgi:HAD superfamily hydrolase (TIGR01457 family)
MALSVAVPTLEQLRNCKAFLLDMDGTLYLDERPLPGALDFVRYLDEHEIPHLFLTNNSSRSGAAYEERLNRIGIPATREQIFTSGDATIEHILNTTDHRSAYLVGTDELASDFRAAGFDLDAADPDCVVVGFDTTVDYEKLERACHLLFADKPYFATHPDRTCITERGLVPDIAAIIAACEAVTRRLPKIIGKPYPEIVASALRRMGTTPETTAMVGDQLDTDQTMAQQSNLCGVLVRTGETTPEKLAAWPDDQKDFLIARGVDELLEWLEA